MIKTYLRNNPKFIPYAAGIGAFCAYLFFYPFRRAYTAGTYEHIDLWGINFKAYMILAQVLGFAISKGIGVSIIAEIKQENKAKAMAMVLVSTMILLGFFAFFPHPYHLLFLVLANIPLGLYYGLILGFLEGRHYTEILVAILTGSFIVGSGFAKFVGSTILNLNVPLFQMPFVSTVIMLPLALLAIWLLHQIPPPTENEINTRGKRLPLNKEDRKQFYKTYFLGLMTFIGSYVILTCFREFRDNFTPEIWREKGVINPSIFVQTEVPVAFCVMGIMVFCNFIKNHLKAFRFVILLMFLGAALILISTLLYTSGSISMFVWFTCSGLGAYVAYAMSNSIFFERFIGAFKLKAHIGFLITLADYYAYFGSLLIVFTKYFLKFEISYATYFTYLCYGISLVYMVFCMVLYVYFNNKAKTSRPL